LALMGLDQVSDYEEEVQKEKAPQGIRQILEWEYRTGKLFSKNKDEFWDGDNPYQDNDLVSPMNGLAGRK